MKSFSSYKLIFIRSALAALLILFLNVSSFSQNLEASYWYFAEQLGLHFTPSPNKDTNNLLYGSNGRATISDKDGNLLLY